MFEKAARLKLRFNSPQGQLTVEDLFDIPLTSRSNPGRANLDDIAKEIHHKIRNSVEALSFVDTSTPNADETLQLSFDIVKRVIEVRVEERDAKRDEVKKREQKQRILELMESKKDAALADKSIEELQALVDNL